MRVALLLVVTALLSGCMTSADKSILCIAFADDSSPTPAAWSRSAVPPDLEGFVTPWEYPAEVESIYPGGHLDTVWLQAVDRHALCLVEQDLRVVAAYAEFAPGDLSRATQTVITGCHMLARGGLLGWLDAKLRGRP